MKTYRGGEVQFCAFLTLEQEEVSGQLHAPAALLPEKELEPPSTHGTEGCVGSRANLDIVTNHILICVM
jgi:hypothetical protein